DQTGSFTQNFTLSLMARGQATGYAFIQDHLIITEVVASTGSSDVSGGAAGWEWVELYNPTTYEILIASRSDPASSFNVFFVTVSYICKYNDDPALGIDTNGSHGASPKRFAFNLIGNNPASGAN